MRKSAAGSYNLSDSNNDGGLLKFGHFLLLLTVSCSTAYYSFWETMGKEKRDLLQSNMQAAQEEQTDVKEKFESTLAKIRHEYSFEEGRLEETYDGLKDDYEDSVEQKEDLSERIDKIEDIASDLFLEWKNEANELKNKKYKSQSKAKLSTTKVRFSETLKNMRKVETQLEGVLAKFKDRVIYLKHNLNAKMIGNFKSEFQSIEKDMKDLMREIEVSNKKAKSFIEELD